MRCLRACLVVLAVLSAGPAPALNPCGQTDADAILGAIAGTWTAEEAVALDNDTTSLLRRPAPVSVQITPDGRYRSALLDDLTGGALPLAHPLPPPYDVDRVDEILAVTESEGFADRLSDTRCGPESLPQFVARLPGSVADVVSGTVTLIVYFDDRLLQITELTLRSDTAWLDMTAAAYLTRTARAAP